MEWIAGLAQDLKHSLRLLVRGRGFTLTALLTLALGIGSVTAIYAVVYGVLVKPLGFAEPERLALIWEHNFERGRRQNVVSPANLRDWRARQHSFDATSLVASLRRNLTGAGEPEEIRVELVEPEFFSLLGARPHRGRLFAASDARPGGGDFAVLAHAFWQRKFGGRNSVVGSTIRLNGRAVEVVGVMPAAFPTLGLPVDAWAPAILDPAIDYRQRAGRFLRVVGRLRSGVTFAEAQTDLAAIARSLETEHPEFNKGWGVNVVALGEQFGAPVRTALLVLLGAVGLLLLAACANIANLLLARGAGRAREMAVRAALGASRARIVSQLLVESVVLAAIGGAAGVALAHGLLQALRLWGPQNLPRLSELRLDPAVLAFAAGLAALAGVFAGLAPAFAAARAASLREGGRSGTAGGAARRVRDVLVVAQIALSLVLLAGAGLLFRSFLRLENVDPGFVADRVLMLNVSLAGQSGGPAQIVAAYQEIQDRLSALPGVERASGVVFPPFGGPGAATGFQVVGRPAPEPGRVPVTDVRSALPGYFETLKIPLRGRLLTAADNRPEAPRAFVVNEALARTLFPNSNPLGQRLIVEMGDDTPGEIVGVVGDAKYASLDGSVRSMVYYPFAHLPITMVTFVLRAQGRPEDLVAAAGAAVRAVRPDQPVAEVRTMEARLGESIAVPRFQTFLLGGFSAVALLLSLVGIYGVMGCVVSERTRELGIRLALGATGGDVRRLVLRRALWLTAIGLGIGLAGALAATRSLRSLLFEVQPGDPATYLAVGAAECLMCLIAAWGPAARAARVDPVEALRAE